MPEIVDSHPRRQEADFVRLQLWSQNVGANDLCRILAEQGKIEASELMLDVANRLSHIAQLLGDPR